MREKAGESASGERESERKKREKRESYIFRRERDAEDGENATASDLIVLIQCPSARRHDVLKVVIGYLHTARDHSHNHMICASNIIALLIETTNFSERGSKPLAL